MQIDLRPAQALRVWVMAFLLGLLIGANNLIKILRDSVFIGHHAVSELPYLYILVAIIAAAIIATYTKYTASTSIIRLILTTNAVIVSNIIFFWVLLTYFDSGWAHYAFYIWSAMATVIAVAQAWTFANFIFTPEEGRRTFGLIAAGGTVGGVAASFGAKWWIHFSIASNHLLWVVAGIYLVASMVVLGAKSRLTENGFAGSASSIEKTEAIDKSGIKDLLSGSIYLRGIGVVILVSVIVSTLIDFQFKTGAKQTYPSTTELAVFFSSYYGWLNVATLFTQVFLTARTLQKIGLGSSLNITPSALLTGSLAIIIWPSLLTTMLTRMADAMLRNSIHRSGMEIIYMAVPAGVVKTVKTFLDVVVERVGDASAGFIILIFSLFSGRYIAYVHFICVGLIIAWLALNRFLQTRCPAALRSGVVLDDTSQRAIWRECD
jgi:ATP/ADP translocase